MGSFLSWLLAEARLPLAESLIGPETVAFTIVHLNEEDPGVRALVHTTLQRLRAMFIDASPLPDIVKKTVGKLAPQNVRAFLPVQLVVTYDHLERGTSRASGVAPSGAPRLSGEPSKTPANAEEDTPVPTVIVSLGRFRGFSDVMFRTILSANEPGSELYRYRDSDILIVPARHPGDITAVGRFDNSYIFSSHREGVQLAVDRLMSGSGAFGGRPPLASLYDRLDAHQDALGAVTSDDGQIRRFLESMARAQDPREGGFLITPAFVEVATATVSRLGWQIDILSQREVSLRLLIECKGATEAQRAQAFLEQLSRDTRQARMLDAFEVRLNGSTVEASFRTSWLQRLLGGATAVDDTTPH